ACSSRYGRRSLGCSSGVLFLIWLKVAHVMRHRLVVSRRWERGGCSERDRPAPARVRERALGIDVPLGVIERIEEGLEGDLVGEIRRQADAMAPIRGGSVNTQARSRQSERTEADLNDAASQSGTQREHTRVHPQSDQRMRAPRLYPRIFTSLATTRWHGIDG